MNSGIMSNLGYKSPRICRKPAKQRVTHLAFIMLFSLIQTSSKIRDKRVSTVFDVIHFFYTPVNFPNGKPHVGWDRGSAIV